MAHLSSFLLTRFSCWFFCHQSHVSSAGLPQSFKWHYHPWKCQELLTHWHSVTSQKTCISIRAIVRTSGFIIDCCLNFVFFLVTCILLTTEKSVGYFFRANFNAHFNMNMYVTLSSTCFGPWHAHLQEEQLHKHSIWYPRSTWRLHTTPVERFLTPFLLGYIKTYS